MEKTFLCKTRTFETQVSGPKNNCLIVGAGRSGTSLTALLLERVGYHVYSTSHPPDEGNPLGYFEDLDVVAANEAILSSVYRSGWQRMSRTIKRNPDIKGTGAWLLDLDYRRLKGVSLRSDDADKFRVLFARTPFAYKDPRFSFTLKAIAPLIPKNTVYVCVFRHPLQVVKSTKKQALRTGLVLDDKYCFAVWEAHYRCLLEHYREMGGQWLFVDYQSLIDGEGASRLEEFLDVQIDRVLIKKELSRSQTDGTVPTRISEMFEHLNELEEIPVSPRVENRA
jgi:hypothetical protein